ncbi:MAG: lipopolysaccharide kinase InaA family protein [Paludibacteraceae bacterium]|nr:lipopolysaccharide kinase InaA family protein [Paludibacteraceae bacterium]
MLIINEKYRDLEGWITSVPDIFPTSGEVIYKARNEIRRIEHDGMAFCVKRYHKPRFPNNFIYSFFREPKAIRAYRNAELLEREGFYTPEAVACILFGRPLGFSYLISVCSPLSRRFYEFRDHGIEGYEDLLDLLGAMAGRMNDQGILHKDFSPGNILFDRVDDDWKIELVDINRMFFGQVSMERGCRNLARLWGDERLIERVARAYARQRHFDEEQCVAISTSAWKRFWRHHHK